MNTFALILLILLIIALIACLAAVFIIHKKLADTKNLLNYTAHELKNCITLLRGEMDIFHKKNIDEKFDFVKRLKKEIKHMNSISHSAQQYLKRSSKKFTKILINKIIKDEIEEFKPLFHKKNIKCELCLTDKMHYPIDETDFTVILRNLLLNAIKYSPEKSTVNINGEKNKDYLIIEVTNEIDRELINRPSLFEGIGLKIISSISRNYKGFLKTKYGDNANYVATVYLPYSENAE